MLLNKDVCKKCIEKESSLNKSNKTDDIKWLRSEVFCPCSTWETIITNSIPNTCPYKLEHLLKEDK